ncbi:hypothetical protein RFI_08569, partial [Reticulomyxa filosa]
MAQAKGNDIGLYGLAVMGQNLALNIADKGFSISVSNRSPEKVDTTLERAKKEKVKGKIEGYKDVKEFVGSIRKPRAIIILVSAGKPVEDVIDLLLEVLEPGKKKNSLVSKKKKKKRKFWCKKNFFLTNKKKKKGDMIVDGERRAEKVTAKKLLYMGMGVSGGEEGARHGPSLMPGGPIEGYKRIEDILVKIAAKSNDGTVCVTHIGPGGAGNYVKMVHNGIEYGDMQLIAEAVIFRKKDDRGKDKDADLVDKVLDKTGQKGTGKWTVREAAEQSIAASTMSAALDVRNLSALYEERQVAARIFEPSKPEHVKNVKQFVDDVRSAVTYPIANGSFFFFFLF